MLVTHANIKGFGLTPLSVDRCGYMPPLLKTKQAFQDFVGCLSSYSAMNIERETKINKWWQYIFHKNQWIG